MTQRTKTLRQLLFLRHGETTSNLANVASGGDRDPDLTETGCAQAREAVQALLQRGLKPTIVFTSPLSRTIHTATIMNEQLQLECIVDETLRERFLGDWNDLSSTLINPKLSAGETPPNGESRVDFRNRIIQYLTNLSAHYHNLPLLIGSRGIARIILESVNFENAEFFPNGKIMIITVADLNDFQVDKIELV